MNQLQHHKSTVPNQDTLFQDALKQGDSLHIQKSYLKALELYDQLTDKFPESAILWNNRGVTLYAMGKNLEAMTSFSRAIKFSPELEQARVALASCYQALGLHEQAITCCNTVLAQNQHNAEAHWNKSLLLLLQGNYQEGWQEYEWRWRKEGFTSPKRNFIEPTWCGEKADGATILVHAEQGYGDTIQFCRYLPLLEQTGMKVIFECHPALVSIAKTISPTITVLEFGTAIPTFNLQIPLLSLPLAFNTKLETIPLIIPYLSASKAIKANHNILSTSRNRLKVGICWAGKQYPDPARSCPTFFLRELELIDGIDWYSLQIAWRNDLPFAMNNLTNNINDFADTANIIATLDLVITIDTAIAHLSGALGKPTWVMLPFAPDWRWLLEREDSPWYPTMRLFRQPSSGNWKAVIGDICKFLKNHHIR